MSGSAPTFHPSVHLKKLAIAAVTKPGLKRLFFRGTSGTGKTYCLVQSLRNLVDAGRVVVVFCANEEMYNDFLAQLNKMLMEPGSPQVLKNRGAVITLDRVDELNELAKETGEIDSKGRYRPAVCPFPDFKVLIGHRKHDFFRTLLFNVSYSVIMFDGLASIFQNLFEPFVKPSSEHMKKNHKWHNENRLLIGTIDKSQLQLDYVDNKAADVIDKKRSWLAKNRLVDWIRSPPTKAKKEMLLEANMFPNIYVWLNHTNRPASLIGWSIDQFYNGILTGDKKGPDALTFIDTSRLTIGADETIYMQKDEKSGSNQLEVRLAVEQAERLVSEGKEPGTIGIIAMSLKQVELIEERLTTSELASGVRVGEIYKFFFTPCEHAVFSQVASSPDAELPYRMLYVHQINMLFQRATKTFVWIGNGEMIEKNGLEHPRYTELIRFLRKEPMYDEQEAIESLAGSIEEVNVGDVNDED